MKKWHKVILGLGVLTLATAGAAALRAGCSDACPGSCPQHTGIPLDTCNVTYDAATGQVKGALCTYKDGCKFENAGGGGAGGNDKNKTIPALPKEL